MHWGAYYVPYSCLLISNKFCNWGGGEQGEQVPLCTGSSAPLSMGLKPLLWALVHKNHLCTYDLYSPVLWVIWAPNGTRLSAWCHFTGPKNSRIPGPNPLPLATQKLSNSRAQSPTTCPRNGYAHIQNIMHEAVEIKGAKIVITFLLSGSRALHVTYSKFISWSRNTVFFTCCSGNFLY